MTLDNKEFWAVSVADVVKTQNKIMKIIDSEIDTFRESKLTEKELAEMEEVGLCETVADVLENLRESIQEELWIDQFGDEPPENVKLNYAKQQSPAVKDGRKVTNG